MSSVRAIPVSHTEALNLVRTWKVNGALIRVEFCFRILAATFRARVADVSDAQLTFVSDDKLAELVLPVPPVATFQYLDLRESPGETWAAWFNSNNNVNPLNRPPESA
jgi:hypothetical protein